MEQTPKKISNKKSQLSDYGKFASLGFQMAAVIGLLTWLGQKADIHFSFKIPLLTLTGAIIGIAVALYWLFKSQKN
jgi:hypothetical protein